MTDSENELRRDADTSDADPHPGPPDTSCRVPSQGEIGSLIAVTAAANLALAHRRNARRRLPRRGDGPAEQRGH
ncbi:hypothetical protein ACIBL8_06755 [Streptomyces sp. NPDC050523]|uniref:hypothetical protein n=1 Tax=Streptomyces sp. NPDC050523 TaxID=3365622 RepID=UPI00379AA453